MAAVLLSDVAREPSNVIVQTSGVRVDIGYSIQPYDFEGGSMLFSDNRCETAKSAYQSLKTSSPSALASEKIGKLVAYICDFPSYP